MPNYFMICFSKSIFRGLTVRKRVRFSSVVFLLSFVVSSVFAQQQFQRGEKYVLRIPLEVLKLESVSSWTGTAAYSASVEQPDANTLSINGVRSWLGKGFPIEKPFIVKKTRSDRQTGQLEVELGGEFAGDPVVKLRFANESLASKLAPLILIRASNQSEIAAWRDAAYAELAKNTFTGALAQLPVERQSVLLQALKSFGAGKVSLDTYKNKSYLAVDLGPGQYVYNTLQMNQTARVGRRMSDVLGSVKALYKAIGACPEGIVGLKITFRASYKNFLREYETGADNVEAYFPCDLIAKFQSADITSQALVNGSVVLVGGDRVEVSLAQ